MKRNNQGFSLIELLIVVVIIGIIAAIAIPNLLAARRSANEGSAISSLRTLHGAQMTYASTYGNGNFAGTVGTAGDGAGLTNLSSQNLVDSTLGSGTKSGYTFVGAREDKTASAPATFFFSAMPATSSGVTATGSRRFGIATDGVLMTDSASVSTQFDETTVAAASPLSN